MGIEPFMRFFTNKRKNLNYRYVFIPLVLLNALGVIQVSQKRGPPDVLLWPASS